MFDVGAPMLVLAIGGLAFLALVVVLFAFTIAARRWAREAAAERWSTGLDGRPVPYEPIEHAEAGAEVLRFPDRPRRPW